MGRVFVAQKDGSYDICVLKLLHTEHENDQAGAQRLRREAHLLSLMAHPHISRVLDAGFEQGAFFLALEYIPGHTIGLIQQTLRKQQRRIPPEVTMVVALDVLDGLGYAHAHRDPDGKPIHLVHRDLSPNNIMLSYHGEAKIIDFGIASGKIDTFKTKPGHIMGTPRYLSPEQASLKAIDHRSDLYSLAVVLYGMFSGRPMIRKGSPAQVIATIVERTPNALTQVITDFPETTWKVLQAGLAKSPEQRWQTAREFREALAASHPWRLPSRQDVGLFLAEWFPEGKQAAEALFARGRANAPSISEGGGFFDTTGVDLPRPKHPITEPEIVPRGPGADAPTEHNVLGRRVCARTSRTISGSVMGCFGRGRSTPVYRRIRRLRMARWLGRARDPAACFPSGNHSARNKPTSWRDGGCDAASASRNSRAVCQRCSGDFASLQHLPGGLREVGDDLVSAFGVRSTMVAMTCATTCS